MRSSLPSRWTAALALVLIAGGATSAHRRDEFLQAARLGIDPARVELSLDLTPGIVVAEGVLAEMDVDGDRSISAHEGQAYAERLLSAIAIDLDGAPLALHLVDSTFPEVDALLGGVGTVRFNMAAATPRLSGGIHHLRYVNAHRADIGVYLANALVPRNDRIAIVSQRRDVDQRGVTIDYRLRADLPTRVHNGVSVAGTGALIWLVLRWRRRGDRNCDPLR